MARKPMIVHQVHGSNANLLTAPAVYALAFSGVTGGFLTATFDGVTSAQIAAGASTPTLANFKTALENTASIGVGNVDVTGTPGGPYSIAFKGALLDTPLVFTVDGTGLTGSTPTATLTYASADLDPFDNSDGMSLIVTGRETIFIYNPSGGSTRTVSEPSSRLLNRLNDTLINNFSIPSPGWLIFPKEDLLGWTQGVDGIHINASGSGLTYLVTRDPED